MKAIPRPNDSRSHPDRPDTHGADADARGNGQARRRHGWARIFGIVVVVLVALVLAVRFIGSPIATRVANQKLSELDGFTGHVGSVKIQPWRGGMVVGDVVLHERGHENDLPVVKMRQATFSSAPGALLRGKLGGTALVEGAEFNVVKTETFEGPVDAAKETAERAKEVRAQAKRWQHALREAFPMELTRLEVKDSKARFVDRTHQPNPDVVLDRLHVVATGMTNRPQPGAAPGALPMKVELTGVSTGGGNVKMGLQADPLAEPLRFNVTFEVRDMQLPPFNHFMRAYTDIDVSRGVFENYLEAKAENGGYNGYVKPFFRDLDFRNVEDKNKNLAVRVKETVVGAATSIMKNDETNKVATETPFSGTFAGNDVDLWQAVENLVGNAFVQALREGLKGQSAGK